MKSIGYCSCGKLWENPDTGLCATCGKLDRKISTLKLPADAEPLNKVSENMGKLLAIYAQKKKAFLKKHKKCAVHPELLSEDIHHQMGRVGYADETARLNEIPLLIDERYFLAVSRIAHKRINNDPKWANEMGYSYLRVTHPIFVKK